MCNNLDIKDEEKQDILLPTNDYVFSRLFGHKGKEDITRDLIEKVTGEYYEDINLENTPILERELLENKKGILDVKVVANKYNDIDIEMQVAKSDYIADRILWYWAKMYSSSMKRGKTYDNTKRAICILIADFSLDKLKSIPEFRTKWNIREEKYKDIILTNKLELIIIELYKLEKNIGKDSANKGLLDWCKFIKNPEEVSSSIMEENKNIKKAKEELDKISQDKHERWLAELREKAILDELALRKTGYNEGKRDGIKEGKNKIAKILLEKKMSLNDVSEITGLSIEELNNIK